MLCREVAIHNECANELLAMSVRVGQRHNQSNTVEAILIVFCLPMLREIDAWLGACRTEHSHGTISGWPTLMAQTTMQSTLKVPPLVRHFEKLLV